jgi:hypothetical protein
MLSPSFFLIEAGEVSQDFEGFVSPEQLEEAFNF